MATPTASDPTGMIRAKDLHALLKQHVDDQGGSGGAMLTMIASSVLPEAFEQSHDASGLSCTLGFLCALVIKAVGTELQRDEPLGH